ncbi:hypothetical protein IB232_09050 [Pseudomonas sp. PDM15]|uniref:hypothetical protein n=1 Tax=Pseudomonas sp. PDM15 TaxID=2769303 RepID=UPI00177F128E|nr:hypothetical protein [Pseudomonas sp. PDM15]MBD9425463.1 hypothetical protein [Pseudomonas sp. PDM15]
MRNLKLEILKPEIHALELDGFLNALRCVIGHHARSFGAALIEKNGRTLESIVDEHMPQEKQQGQPSQKTTVDFEFIQKIFNEKIYSKLPPGNSETIKNINWNLIEYYGLISSTEDEEGPWNRLISQNSVCIEHRDEEDQGAITFFVEHHDFVIATYL